MSGGKEPQQEQKTTTEMGPEQRALFDLAFPRVKEYAATVPERYQGSTIADFNPDQTTGQNLVRSVAPTQQNIVEGGAGASQFWTGDNVWDPANNEGLSRAVDSAVRPITQAYTQDYLPAVRSEVIKAGGLGGSRQGVFEAIGAEKTSRAIGDTANRVVQDAYATNVRAQLQALGLVPNTAQAQTIPGATVGAVGDVRQGMEQAKLNEIVNNFTYDQIAPYLQAKDILALTNGMPGGSTISTANNPPQPSTGTKMLGGAATGAALGSAIMPGIGTGVGAGFGAVMPFLLG